ncbi:MAG: CREG family protein [Actinomycetota bacterium]|nr:CREG family protein [Actinomycetota bacterium]
MCTLAVDPPGHPFGSLVAYALDSDGSPLFLLSRMAEHTRNLTEDGRAALLVAEPAPDGADPLAAGRVTLLGTVSAAEDGRARERYLAANPSAAGYVDFGDFAFHRLDVQAVRYVGGYGRMSWVDAAAYAVAEPGPTARPCSTTDARRRR